MKKIFFILAIISTCLLMTSCYYDDTDIKNALDEYVEKQDSININTSQEQSEAMEKTLQKLKDLEASIRSYMDDSLSVKFQQEIDSLTSLIVDLQNADDSIYSWVSSTYTTLEQYEQLSNLLSLTKNELLNEMADMDSTLRADINTQLLVLESSMRDWVSNQLKGYYTISEVDSLLQLERANTAELIAQLHSAMNAKVDSLDAALQDSLNFINNALLDSIALLQKSIINNQIEIDSARAQLTREYQTAISGAIESYDGVIKSYIATQIDSINLQLTASIDTIKQDIQSIQNDINNISNKVTEIEDRLSNIEKTLANLLKQIQSVTYLPQYVDGSVQISRSITKIDTIWNTYTDTIKSQINGTDSLYIPHKDLIRIDTTFVLNCEPIEFLITPSTCVEVISEQMLSVKLLAQKPRLAPAINSQTNSSIALELTAKDVASGIIQISLKDSEALRDWYFSNTPTSLALFIDDEATNTHINSGFVVELIRKDSF